MNTDRSEAAAEPGDAKELIDGHTLQEWRDLGSAEANSWTIVTHDGKVGDLNSIAASRGKAPAGGEAKAPSSDNGTQREYLENEERIRAAAKAKRDLAERLDVATSEGAARGDTWEVTQANLDTIRAEFGLKAIE